MAQRLALRHGTEAAAKALAQPVRRDGASIAPLDRVSLGGRTLDFWVGWGDGRERRPVMLALVDVASDMGSGLGARAPPPRGAASAAPRSGTAIFDRLHADDGTAFMGHVGSGGASHEFRRRSRDERRPEPPGACHHLGIEVKPARPGNPGAKIAERSFATLSRAVDDRPELAGAHAGHAPGASPGSGVRAVPIAEAVRVIEREVARHNREPGRRSQGARGRFHEAVFKAGLKGRATAAPRRLARLVHADPPRWIGVDGEWTARSGAGPTRRRRGGRHHERGRVWIGRDPADLHAPAVAFDPATGRCIGPRLEAVVPGAYGSLDAARRPALAAHGGPFVVVDGVRHLAPDALEWLRAIREAARTPMAFVGDLALERAVRAIPPRWGRAGAPGDPARAAPRRAARTRPRWREPPAWTSRASGARSRAWRGSRGACATRARCWTGRGPLRRRRPGGAAPRAGRRHRHDARREGSARRTTNTAQWVPPLAPEEVERAHWSLLALASYPNEVIEVAAELAAELAAVMREDPDCGARLEPIVARLAQGSKLAHERADWLFERAQKGTLHEAKGGIQ